MPFPWPRWPWLALLLWRSRNEFNSATLALSLILGGALGNLWDRLTDGKVTDFLDFYVGIHHWPPFNVADSAIVVGALLLLMRMLRKEKQVGRDSRICAELLALRDKARVSARICNFSIHWLIRVHSR